LENTIKKILSLGLKEESLPKLLPLFEKAEFPKSHMLIKAGRTERSVYLLEKGIARAFCHKDDKEINFWLGAESNILLSYNSFFLNTPGYENIELLEDSVLYKISHNALQNLYLTDLELANWGRRLAESELIKAEECFIARQFKTAKECYEGFITASPDILQRVQLGHIASYLGISQVTLSRIRAEIR
jgi:CRP-like cAMP-binding protein